MGPVPCSSFALLRILTSCPYRTTIEEVRAFGIIWILCLFVGLAPSQTQPPSTETTASAGPVAPVDLSILKRLEVERLRSMAESGAIPRARLDQAQAELADAEDNMILRRTLYGSVRVEDFTDEQAAEMVAAAERLVARQQERYDAATQLVNEGVVARVTLTAMLEDLEFRRKALDLSRYRAKLVEELGDLVDAEQELEADTNFSPRRIIERYDGSGIFREVDFAKLHVAFQRQFAKPLPISARGGTALHRKLGFDHRGRVDVALNPDQREGVWLRSYLKKLKIPYYAFRAAVRGKATAPHIHLGPPSLRLRLAD